MTNTYYYPISTTSLGHIFSCACIFPAAFYSNRNKDIQDNIPNVILLTSNYGCNECNCILEVFITDTEKEFLTDIGNGFFVYERPLPISRIKRIHFRSSEQAHHTISVIRVSTAYIPDSIVDYNDNDFNSINAGNLMLPDGFDVDILTYKSWQDSFDRFLGALALMRTAHKEGFNASPRFIDSVAFFNDEIRRIKSEVGRIDTTFYHVLKDTENIMGKKITEDILNEYAKRDNLQIIKKKLTGVIDIDQLDKTSYILATLITYGTQDECTRKRIDTLILENFQSIKPGYEEKIAFYFGYNRGYSALGKEYTYENKHITVKFKLESLLDYYIIESVFNKVVFNKESSKFDYFDWVPTQSRSRNTSGYMVLDTCIIDKKKAELFSAEWWSDCFSSFVHKENLTFMGVDFYPRIEESILKPCIQRIVTNLKKDHDSEIKILFQQVDDSIVKISKAEQEISRLRNELALRDEQISALKNQLVDYCNAPSAGESVQDDQPTVINSAMNENVPQETTIPETSDSGDLSYNMPQDATDDNIALGLSDCTQSKDIPVDNIANKQSKKNNRGTKLKKGEKSEKTAKKKNEQEEQKSLFDEQELDK